ncbi:hypothetical protein ACU6U9_16215 [Pseudomonas sp. HK3]|jgi:hypothetical protein
MELVVGFLTGIGTLVILLLAPAVLAAEFACVLVLFYGLFLKVFDPSQYRVFDPFKNGRVERLLVLPIFLTLASAIFEASQPCCQTTFASFLFNVQLVLWGVGVAVVVFAFALRKIVSSIEM